MGVNLNGWLVIAGIVTFVFFVSFLKGCYQRIKENAENNSKNGIYPLLLRVERVFESIVLILLGAVIYHRWMDDPVNGYILMGITMLMIFSQTPQK